MPAPAVIQRRVDPVAMREVIREFDELSEARDADRRRLAALLMTVGGGEEYGADAAATVREVQRLRAKEQRRLALRSELMTLHDVLGQPRE